MNALLLENWTKTTLGQVTTLGTERVLPINAPGQPYLSLEHLERDTHKIVGTGRSEDVISTKTRFRAGDVLYGRLRPNLNKVVIPTFDGLCSTDILVFAPSGAILNSYLIHLFSEKRFISYATQNVKGINLPRISIQALNDYPIDLPPIEEQARIVNRIDSLEIPLALARLRVKTATRLARNLHRLILHRAVNGQLLQAWRDKENPRSDSAPIRSVVRKSKGNLPVHWKQVRIGDVGDVQVGRQRAPKHHAGTHMRPYLRVANVFEDYIDTADVMEMNFSPREYEVYKLKYGDILLNEGQSLDLIGRPAMFRDDVPGAAFTNTLIRFRSAPEVRAEYALLVFREYFHGGHFQKIAKITTNLAHLGLNRFADLSFLLPSLEEQDEIIKACNQCFAKLKVTEHLFSNLLLDAESLRQSILSRGIRGLLVPQMSDDTDAATLVELLADIKASQAPSTLSRAPKRTVRRNAVRKLESVTEALAAARKPLNSKDLFLRCGYPDDASSEQVELFFLDLRASLRGGRIVRTRKGDEDIFDLVG